MRGFDLLAVAAALSTASATFQGFNYGSTQSDGSIKTQQDFQVEFQTAKKLAGTNGAFTSARLYTMVQGGTANTVISAIPAAIAEDTSLLLGLWASGGDAAFSNEITALKTAIQQFGTQLAPLVAGISVGSEDLYRISPTGIAANSGLGANPDTIASYISQVRDAIKGTPLSGATIGHVDTWTAWVNGSNNAVIEACDWIGMDAYPYFQNTESNGIETGAQLLKDAYSATQGAVGGKPVWITETGWPVSGSTENLAVPNTQNAKTYWDQVGCDFAFGKINTWWFTLQDSAPVTPNPSFGVIGSTLTTTPLFDLSCSGSSSSSSSSSAAASSSTTSSAAASSTTTTSAASSSSSGSGSGGSSGGSSAVTTSAPASSTPAAQSSAPASSSPSGFSSVVAVPTSGSGVSSALSAATSLATGGTGLSPTEGNGNGGAPGTTVTATPTGSSGNNGSGSGSGANPSSGSGLGGSTGSNSSVPTGAGSPSSTPSGPSQVGSNAGNMVSAPILGSVVIGFAAMVAAL
ncbi:GPI-anchored cell wall beta-1,3-endoglucanase EglC [Xylogone sp. PMI_703]|nr:GPI-anchored cell wall beta-1,3-endoglucanase EglC [Xylogone sp. PMI_703]